MRYIYIYIQYHVSSYVNTWQDIYLENPDVHWDDIIGLDAAKRLVKEAVVYPIKVPLITIIMYIHKAAHFHFEKVTALGVLVLLCLVVCLTLLAFFFFPSHPH